MPAHKGMIRATPHGPDRPDDWRDRAECKDDPIPDLLVLVDDFALPAGTFRLRAAGSDGGHNGLKSITGLIGPGYVRLRVGVDRPPSTDPDVVAEYVLSPFRESRAEVDALTASAADAVELWLDAGLEEAAGAVNRLDG